MLGYEASTQFILWDVEDQRVIFSRDVQFDEMAQGLCDIEALQQFRSKIKEIHQDSNQSSDQVSDENNNEDSN